MKDYSKGIHLLIIIAIFASCIADDLTFNPKNVVKRQVLGNGYLQSQASLSFSRHDRPSILSGLIKSARERIHETANAVHSVGESVHQAIHEGVSQVDIPFSGSLDIHIDRQGSHNDYGRISYYDGVPYENNKPHMMNYPLHSSQDNTYPVSPNVHHRFENHDPPEDNYQSHQIPQHNHYQNKMDSTQNTDHFPLHPQQMLRGNNGASDEHLKKHSVVPNRNILSENIPNRVSSVTENTRNSDIADTYAEDGFPVILLKENEIRR